ncbi:MAG: phosphoglucosamine mutase [Pseudomonadota bacterium]
MGRKYFGTDGIRGLVNQHPVTAEFASKLGVAAGHYFRSRHEKFRVVIGKDTRRSCYMLEAALSSGLMSVGAEVMWLGPIPTPAVGILTKSMRADFGMMISASHNPYHDNGIKLFGGDGFKLSDDIELEIENLIDNLPDIELSHPEKVGRTIRYESAQARYIEVVKASFPRHLSLDGKRIVIDCANGAAYQVAPQILFELGAEVIPLSVAPNGFNINASCGALHPEKMKAAVLEHKADLGIALDGDADRIIMCDEYGNILNGDVIIGIIARAMQQRGVLRSGKVATTIMSNMALEKFLNSMQIDTIQTSVGDRYVVEAMRQHDLNIGGEQSGHIVLSDYATTGDGLLAALQVLAYMQEIGQSLYETSQIFTPFPQLLTNVRYARYDPLQDNAVQNEIEKAKNQMGGDGRIFIRKSGTEPLIRIMVEAEDENLMQKVSKDLTNYISSKV